MKVWVWFGVLLVLGALSGAHPVASDVQQRPIVSVYDPSGGVQVPVEDGGCWGTAPLDHWCTVGTMGSGVASVGCGAGSGYTGTVESILVWSNGFRWLACSFEDGRLIEVHAEGTFPGLGEMVRIECWSYELGTAGELPRPNGLGPVLTAGPLQGREQAESDPQGIPGGEGEWGCSPVG